MSAEIIDQASELEELLRNNAIQAHRINHNAVSATECEECGDQLPEARRKAYPGCTMCVSCAEEIEFRKKQGRM
ncbi:TPA: TraR/DksA family transcriptional regulator [Klebsiella michiganensis]|uniref:TraR/DksA family transcriptional regulator n=1 Tax=Klebsiella michiganensis TaxID=1134687 RepID=UPI0012B9462A|nr:TraR/DksA family transcriptional regulator [Klebsiella michiganensis]ELO7623694.1 TraR/DksA family transcriptional regulator [Klebsiella michiganensis]QWA87598.1 TraR/DksA family transcriptional regulator [Klebsiella michiganensis]HDX8758174.1 TraR/DksA family transcriptional regulator [Klebsiella michiganensis]